MITKGIIIETPNTKKLSGLSSNKYRVRIPLFESAGISTIYVVDACLCYGSLNELDFKPGDVVYVAFENNELDMPVIMGKLYCDKNLVTDSSGSLDMLPELSAKVDQLQKQIDNHIITYFDNLTSGIKILPTISLTSAADRVATVETQDVEVQENCAIIHIRIKAQEYALLKPTDELTICAYKSVKRRRNSSYRHRLVTLYSVSFSNLNVVQDSKGDYIVEFNIPTEYLNYSYNAGGPKTRYIRIRRKLMIDDCHFSNSIGLVVRYDATNGDSSEYPIFQLIS